MDNKPQYISNVLMKVNAKLGGVTSRAIPKTPASTLRPQSVIIGADVTHPMLGVWTPSLAAMCISNDPQGISYMGGCQTNGDLKEIITPENVREILLPLMLEWNATLGKGGKPPKHIYYFRDGVSESEFLEVLQKEVLAIKKVAAECLKLNSWSGKMTVIVANKRHHLRAFPKPTDKSCSDRNGNPLPGLLVNRDVTSPHGWDFLLYSHAALQGTSRPVHYTVLLDEIGHKPEELENMIYEHCYQYVRSTTPVSVHPSIYYAHLISVRARHHEDIPASSGPQHGTKVPMRRELEHPRQKEKDDFREKQKEHTQEMLKGNPGHRFGESVPKPIPSSQDPAKGAKEKEEKPAPKLAGSRLLPIIGTSNRLSYKMWWI
jgi:eukaryotic translation initiation factor 2C